MADKRSMAGFAERAQQLLEAAAAASQNGALCSEMTVLIAPDGAIQMSANSDWPLDSLARERGARAVYRVTSRYGGVRVEGREGSRTCVLESAAPRPVPASPRPALLLIRR